MRFKFIGILFIIAIMVYIATNFKQLLKTILENIAKCWFFEDHLLNLYIFYLIFNVQ